jgi:hypothetical protein
VTWTLSFAITVGRDPDPDRDSDHVGTHHDAGRLGFAPQDAAKHIDVVRVPERPVNAAEANLMRPAGNTATEDTGR